MFKKTILLAALFASPITYAIDWQEKYSSFESAKSMASSNINQIIQKNGGLDRMKKVSNGKTDGDFDFVMGNMYLYGILEPQNTNKGFEILKKSAYKNHLSSIKIVSQIQLGLNPLFEMNTDLRDEQSGIKLLHEAAEQGDGKSQMLLSLYYMDGELVEEDRDLALFWMTRSKTSGYEPAYSARKEMINKNNFNNVSFDYVRQRAAEGNREYLVKLAELYSEGWVVQRNEDKAIRLLKTAAELGSKNAISMLKERSISQ